MAQIQVTRPTPEQFEEMEIGSWPIWTCDVSRFPWHYDRQETCYILEGRVTVQAGQEKVTFGPGDMVVFPVGLDCTWEVTEPVRKHYKFD